MPASRSVPRKFARLLGIALLVAVAAGAVLREPAQSPAAPSVSTFAPVDDLLTYVDSCLESFAPVLASAEAYDRGKARLEKDADSLAAVALALHLHDQEHRLKHHAGVMFHAAQRLATAADYAAAQHAWGALQAANRRETSAVPELAWQRAGEMGIVMKQVTLLHNKLKRGARPGSRFEAGAEENARLATVLAVLAQCTQADVPTGTNPADTAKWYDLCAEMRDYCSQTSQALHARDQAATATALDRVEQNCNACHDVFRKQR
ncbi:MAG: cytochrome c [Pirellulales bacterium]|nr:cytochrome c [Pirellulales bacterium]